MGKIAFEMSISCRKKWFKNGSKPNRKCLFRWNQENREFWTVGLSAMKKGDIK
jgi:hypothetical protein